MNIKTFSIIIISFFLANITLACNISGSYNQNQILSGCPEGTTNLIIADGATVNISGSGWDFAGSSITSITIQGSGSMDFSGKDLAFFNVGSIIIEDVNNTSALIGTGNLIINGTTYTQADFSSIISAGGVDENGLVVLDVELGKFDIVTKDNIVNLIWETLSEDNNYGFEIERNSNGNWETIGFVEGAGNSLESINYTFEDNEPVIGNNYYRLKIIDFSGTIEYSSVVETEILAKNNYAVQISPNPVSNNLNIQASDDSVTNLRIFNMSGQVVKNMTFSANTMIDVSNLEQGIYIIALENNGFYSQEKISIIH